VDITQACSTTVLIYPISLQLLATLKYPHKNLQILKST